MPKEALKNLKETNEGRKVKMRKMLKNKNGITLIALVVTIVVLLILAGVTLKLVLDNNGIIQKSKEARSETIVADEKSKVEMAYLSAALKKLGDTVTAEELQEELDSSVGAGKTVVTTNGNGTLNVLFNATGHNYNVDEGTVEKVEIDNTKMAMFDTGENVAKKMYALAPDGYMQYAYSISNLSIDGIKKYKGTPDLSIPYYFHSTNILFPFLLCVLNRHFLLSDFYVHKHFLSLLLRFLQTTYILDIILFLLESYSYTRLDFVHMPYMHLSKKQYLHLSFLLNLVFLYISLLHL